MKEILGDFSVREKNLWFELMVDVVVALYYYPKVAQLIVAGGGALSGAAMTGLIVKTVTLAIVISIILSIFLHTQAKPEPRDERDHMIEAKSNLWYSRILTTGVVLVMGLAVAQQFNPWAGYSAFELTPLVLAHLLLFALMLSSLVNSVMKIVMYRRGYA